MTGHDRLTQPADTLFARRMEALVASVKALTGRSEFDLMVGILILGALAGSLGLGPVSLILGLPMAAAALARNIRPDLAADEAATRAGRVIEKFFDAIIFCIGAGLLFYPGYVVGAFVSSKLLGAWGVE